MTSNTTKAALFSSWSDYDRGDWGESFCIRGKLHVCFGPYGTSVTQCDGSCRKVQDFDLNLLVEHFHPEEDDFDDSEVIEVERSESEVRPQSPPELDLEQVERALGVELKPTPEYLAWSKAKKKAEREAAGRERDGRTLRDARFSLEKIKIKDQLLWNDRLLRRFLKHINRLKRKPEFRYATTEELVAGKRKPILPCVAGFMVRKRHSDGATGR